MQLPRLCRLAGSVQASGGVGLGGGGDAKARGNLADAGPLSPSPQQQVTAFLKAQPTVWLAETLDGLAQETPGLFFLLLLDAQTKAKSWDEKALRPALRRALTPRGQWLEYGEAVAFARGAAKVVERLHALPPAMPRPLALTLLQQAADSLEKAAEKTEEGGGSLWDMAEELQQAVKAARR